MNYRTTTLPKKYHQAVCRWGETFLPDFDLLIENWDKHFPKDPKFELCAYRECGMCGVIECGTDKGKPKHEKVATMNPEQAHHLLGAIRAQASTEFGSIQQHQLTLARAQTETDQFWVLRMMAEELRHGYQMLHLLLEDDWAPVSKQKNEDVVEEILEMRTGSHVLGAFNVDFDSFVDNIVFCALIDRVGKFQLSMQRISAYQPMAESMPQMLREEAFHLATGVVPMRRWVSEAATGSVYVTMDAIQKSINKWFPRGLEMFGDERGGGTNVKFGLKPMKNSEAQQGYFDEVSRLIDDVNVRYVRARVPALTEEQAEDVRRRVIEHGETLQGISRADLLKIPHKEFFRRRGEPAFKMVGVEGQTFTDAEAYVKHVIENVPDSYRTQRDFKFFVDTFREVAAGTLTRDEAAGKMPVLSRVGGVCPCSRAVRWVQE